MSDEPIKPVGLMNQPVSEEETSPEREARLLERREARAAIPAVYVDDWAVLTWEGHIRVVLGEWLAGKNNYRMAFVMSLNEAQEFAEDLLERITRRKLLDAEEAKTAKTPSSPESEV